MGFRCEGVYWYFSIAIGIEVDEAGNWVDVPQFFTFFKQKIN